MHIRDIIKSGVTTMKVWDSEELKFVELDFRRIRAITAKLEPRYDKDDMIITLRNMKIVIGTALIEGEVKVWMVGRYKGEIYPVNALIPLMIGILDAPPVPEAPTVAVLVIKPKRTGGPVPPTLN